jgi:hypothetical protein
MKAYSINDDGTVTVKATSIKWKAGMVLCLDYHTMCLTYQVFAGEPNDFSNLYIRILSMERHATRRGTSDYWLMKGIWFHVSI